MSRSFMSIGEFSKLVGVSPEFLKFYDKKNLVKPAWKDDRSYRYYGDFQITHFLELQQLNNMGLSLEESKDVIQKYSLNERLDVYKKAYAQKEKEMQALSLLMNQMSDTTTALEKIHESANWRIEEYPTCYFVFTDTHKRLERTSAFWKDNFSMNIAQYVQTNNACYELIPGNFHRIWGTIQPSLPSEKEENDTIIPVGGCNCFIYEYSIPTDYDDEGKLSDKVWDLSLPLSILKENGIVHTGHFFQKRLCITHEKNGEYLQVQTIIPL